MVPAERRRGKHAGYTLGKGLDRTAFPRSIAALKDDNDAQPFVPHPLLQLADFDLKFAQFLFVFLAFEFCLLDGRLVGVLH